MIITQQILDELSAKARASERLRMNMDLRNGPEDLSETVVVIRGKIRWIFYDVIAAD